MKKLVMSALLLGGLQAATGCFIVSDDDDGPPPPPPVEEGDIEVTWELLVEAREDGSDDPLVEFEACAGARNVTVLIDDVNDDAGPEEFVDEFRCIDGGGTFTAPLGNYDVWLEFTRNDGTIVQTSVKAEVDLVEDGQTVAADFENITLPEQGIVLTWDIMRNLEAGGQAEVACADLPTNDGVSLVVTQAVEGWDDIWDCEEGQRGGGYVAATDVLPTGTYTFSPSLIEDPDDDIRNGATAIGVGPEDTVTIRDNEYVDIRHVLITLL